MNKYSAVIGSGGHARVIASILRANKKSILGFFDNSFSGSGSLEIIQGSPLLGTINDVLKFKNKINSVFLAIGNNLLRKKTYQFLLKHNFTLLPLVHPAANIDINVSIDSSSVVCLGANICTEVKIGKGCILNTGCSVDHESHIKDFVHLAPQSVVAGRSVIGENTFIGMNVSIADNVVVGSNAIIGAGSIILKDVMDNSKILGVHH